MSGVSQGRRRKRRGGGGEKGRRRITFLQIRNDEDPEVLQSLKDFHLCLRSQGIKIRFSPYFVKFLIDPDQTRHATGTHLFKYIKIYFAVHDCFSRKITSRP